MCAFTGTFRALQRQARGTLDGTNGPAMMTVYIQCACVSVRARVCCDYAQSIKAHFQIIQMLSNQAHPNSPRLSPLFFLVFSPLLSLLLADKRPWRSLTKQVGNTPSAPPSTMLPASVFRLKSFFPLKCASMSKFYACGICARLNLVTGCVICQTSWVDL